MVEENIYGKYEAVLYKITEDLFGRITACQEEETKKTGDKISEHISCRVKTPDSMTEKCIRKGLEPTLENALTQMHDAIGLRIVCDFVDDIYKNVELIKKLSGCRVTEEKDYIKHAKENGYRSYHMILDVETPYEDIYGNTPGHFFAEIQLRTIAMDTWASLEHEMKYKRSVENQNLIVSELKRCADELASCDLSMQTIKKLIRGE